MIKLHIIQQIILYYENETCNGFNRQVHSTKNQLFSHRLKSSI